MAHDPSSWLDAHCTAHTSVASCGTVVYGASPVPFQPSTPRAPIAVLMSNADVEEAKIKAALTAKRHALAIAGRDMPTS